MRGNTLANNIDTLKELLYNVMGVPVDETTSSDTCEAWDSLRHLNLVLALEDKFDISFTEDESVNLFSYADIKQTLDKHGVDFS